MTGTHRKQREPRATSHRGRRQRPHSTPVRLARIGLGTAALATIAASAYGSIGPGSEPKERAEPSGTSGRNGQQSPADPNEGPLTTADPVVLTPLVPNRGSGQFGIAPRDSPATGEQPLLYSVEVERELSVEPSEFAAAVEATLAHPEGWRAVGGHEFRRVESGAQIRILLATPRTVDELCAPLKTRGEVSCRNRDLVVINAKRWFLGAEAFPRTLLEYRHYVVNHEVGHALGYPHEDCPEDGAPAPVMLQQTISLDGCAPNPWPSHGPPRHR